MKFIFFFLLITTSLFAQENSMRKRELHEKWLQYSTPGSEHKLISELAGAWNYETKWTTYPGAKETSFKGTVNRKMTLGGRFLLSESKHKTPWKMSYLDHGLLGYNNLAKRYEAFVANNFGTGMNFYFGEYNPDNKTFIFRGLGTFYAAKNHEAEYRIEMKIVDKNTVNLVQYLEGIEDGKDFKQAETVYKRKK